MANIQKIKKSLSDRKNIGGTKPFGQDLDPNKDLKLVKDKEKGQQAYYKGRKMKYLDYYNEICTRGEKNKLGKDLSIGYFGGISFDKQGKIIRRMK